MKFSIVKRKSLCDKKTYFYELYVNGCFLCGFYNKKLIKARKYMYKRGIKVSDYYMTRTLSKKYHLA